MDYKVEKAKILESLTKGKDTNQITFYYGLKGKQLATERFLSEVIAAKSSVKLSLISDEYSDWLIMDPSFEAKWDKLMTQALHQGNRIRIIHDIDVKYGKMQMSLQNWMQLYMTGMIEAYYYPGIRDGLVNITRFIAPGLAAIVSSNFENSVEENLNIYITNPKAIRALEKEFDAFKDQCQPLMDHYNIRNFKEYWDLHKDQYQTDKDIICLSDSLSMISAPLDCLLEKGQEDINFSLNILEKLQNILLDSLTYRTYTEIIPLDILNPDKDDFPYIYKSSFLQMENKLYTKNL